MEPRFSIFRTVRGCGNRIRFPTSRSGDLNLTSTSLFLGRFSPEKNCHLLIHAYKQINTDIKFVLAGGSSYSDAYIQGLLFKKATACVF